MNTHTAIFDHWIRTEFVTLNSELEQLYWQQTDKANVCLLYTSDAADE